MKLFLLLFIALFMICSPIYADAGDKSVTLNGKIVKSTPESVALRQLEKSFRVFKAYLYNPWEKKSAHYEGVIFV